MDDKFNEKLDLDELFKEKNKLMNIKLKFIKKF